MNQRIRISPLEEERCTEREAREVWENRCPDFLEAEFGEAINRFDTGAKPEWWNVNRDLKIMTVPRSWPWGSLDLGQEVRQWPKMRETIPDFTEITGRCEQLFVRWAGLTNEHRQSTQQVARAFDWHMGWPGSLQSCTPPPQSLCLVSVCINLFDRLYP